MKENKYDKHFGIEETTSAYIDSLTAKNPKDYLEQEKKIFYFHENKKEGYVICDNRLGEFHIEKLKTRIGVFAYATNSTQEEYKMLDEICDEFYEERDKWCDENE